VDAEAQTKTLGAARRLGAGGREAQGAPSSNGLLKVEPADRRGYGLRRVLVVADLLALGLALLAAEAVRGLSGRGAVMEESFLLAVLLPLWVPLGISAGLYHVGGRSATAGAADELAPVGRVATAWSWSALIVIAAIESGPLQLLPLLSLWALSIPAVLFFRAVARRLCRSRPWYRQRTLVIGSDADARKLMDRIERNPDWALDVVGRIHPPRTGSRLEPGNGNGDGLDRAVSMILELVTLRQAARVMFAGSPEALDERTAICRRLSEIGVQVDFVPGDPEILRANASLHDLEGLPVLSLPATSPARWQGVVKRGVDLMVAVPMLIVTFPLLAYATIRIKLDSPGPVFFRQERAGRNETTFRVFKFRTMVVDAEERRAEVAALALHGQGVDSGIFKAVGDPRVTTFGAWLRRWSIDELPQLWNVIRGEMSIIGPRPLPVAEDRRICEHYRVRRSVRPGISGSWQVKGRSNIPYEDMIKLDYTYVVSWSLGEDMKLLARTVSAVLASRGAY
jgi:exopolysaccharide biosynthesis polyprenyl glycosylphosphotransferase